MFKAFLDHLAFQHFRSRATLQQTNQLFSPICDRSHGRPSVWHRKHVAVTAFKASGTQLKTTGVARQTAAVQQYRHMCIGDTY
jgi:hypothetical protein